MTLAGTACGGWMLLPSVPARLRAQGPMTPPGTGTQGAPSAAAARRQQKRKAAGGNSNHHQNASVHRAVALCPCRPLALPPEAAPVCPACLPSAVGRRLPPSRGLLLCAVCGASLSISLPRMLACCHGLWFCGPWRHGARATKTQGKRSEAEVG